MLDIPRLERIRLRSNPLTQRLVGHLLGFNFRWLARVRVEFEHEDRLPATPVIYAMNHTDRYNYFPFLWLLWQRFDRFCATWVKGKYYENALIGAFMEKTNQLPTVSRGYLITKDFTIAVGRVPDDEEYAILRHWVDAAAGGLESVRPDLSRLPEVLLSRPRDVLGYAFDPEKEDYASYINSIFRIMMRRFLELNREAPMHGLDILIFPQGTRSRRLLPGHIGISEMALHLKLPVVPVGCNGSDLLYPGGSPLARSGRVTYRFGEAISYDELEPHHVVDDFEPFSADAEKAHRARFEAVAALVTDRIDALLDEPYRRAPDAGEDATRGANRFLVS